MKTKKEYFILGGVILALILYLVFKGRDRDIYPLPEIAKIDVTEVSKIEVSRKGGSIVLSKKEGQWYIDSEEYPADTKAVETMLETIGELAVTVVVSESKNYERYDLADDQKIGVTAWIGERPVREFEIGKTAPSYQHTFVKLGKDDPVYHAKGSFRYSFDKAVEELRDKTALSFDTAEITEMKITKGKDRVIITRNKTTSEAKVDQGGQGDGTTEPGKGERIWQTNDGTILDEAKCNDLLGSLSKLRLENYIEGLNKEAFKDPIYSIQLKGKEDHALSIYEKRNKDDKEHPASSSFNPYPFTLSEEQLKSVMKTPDDLLTILKK